MTVDGTILLEQELEEAKERGLGRLNAAVINEAGTLLALGKPEINLRQMITQINSAAFTRLEDGDVQMMEAKDAKRTVFSG